LAALHLEIKHDKQNQFLFQLFSNQLLFQLFLPYAIYKWTEHGNWFWSCIWISFNMQVFDPTGLW